MSAVKKVIYATTALTIAGSAMNSLFSKAVYDAEVLESHHVSKSLSHRTEIWVETSVGSVLFRRPFDVHRGDKISFRVNLLNKRAKLIR